MPLHAIWISTGDARDAAIFSRRFKIQRGRASALATRAADETCYGVLCYENGGEGYGAITEIVAPMLSLKWARQAVKILEEHLPEATVAQWEPLEDALREAGYAGKSICPYYLPDAVGFAILEESADYATAELERAAPGVIEKILLAKGCRWVSGARTWQNAEGNLWMVEGRFWQTAGGSLFLGKPGRQPATARK